MYVRVCMYIVIGMSVIACFGKGRLPETDTLTHLRTYFQSCKNQDEASGSESGRIVVESDRNPFCDRKKNCTHTHDDEYTQHETDITHKYINPFLFQGLFFYVYMESPNPKNPEGPTPRAPNHII